MWNPDMFLLCVFRKLPHSGKTAVLFNMALKAFARRKYRVLFVCNRQKMERRAKSIANLLEFEDGAFKNVFMRYLSDPKPSSQTGPCCSHSILTSA